jgi:hypothetical protein
MAKRTRAVVMAALVMPVALGISGFLTACSGSNDAGTITEIKSLPDHCELKLKGDKSGWVKLKNLTADQTEVSNFTSGVEICHKAVVGNTYTRGGAKGESITVTVYYTLTFRKAQKPGFKCAIGKYYDSRNVSSTVNKSPKAVDCASLGAKPYQKERHEEPLTGEINLK